MGEFRISNRDRTVSRRAISKSQRISLASLAVVFLAGCHSATSYSGGAPPAVCESMKPGHGAEPQTSTNPYKVIVSKVSASGFDTIDITLTSKTGQEQFKGFMIQVRKVSGDTKTVGQFSDTNLSDDVTTMDCNGKPKSGVTHTNGNLKSSVHVQWITPNDEDAEYQVYYTVVGLDSEIYWVQVPHEEKIRVTRNTLAVNPMAPATSEKVASDELRKKWSEVYEGCGKTKGCFGMPGKCVEEYDSSSNNPTTCDIIVTWAKKGGKSDKGVFQLSGRSKNAKAGYVAVGLSEDKSMGQDSVVGCIIAREGIDVFRYYNPSKSNEVYANRTEGLTVTGKSLVDGNIFCDFEQTNHKVGDLQIDFNKDYYFLLAKAPSASENKLGYHQAQEDRAPSPQAINIADTIIMGASAQPWLIQLHGGLNVIAWLLCASTGMFTARYFKLTHTDFTPCGKAFWFALHITCMAATVFLTICGSVFIFINRGLEPLKSAGLHAILGAIVVGLAIVQVIIAFLRPHPGTPSRPYFNWFHWLVGNSAHIVGIICILLASGIDLADLKRFGDENLWGWILLGIVLFHVLMHLVMSVHTLWADKQMDAMNQKRAVTPGPMKTNGLTEEAPGTTFRTFMLSLYLLVMAAGAITLVALIFWPKKPEEEPVQ